MAKTNSTGSGSEHTQESMVKMPGNDFNEALLRLSRATAVVDSIYTLASNNQLEALCDGSLASLLDGALHTMHETAALLEGNSGVAA